MQPGTANCNDYRDQVVKITFGLGQMVFRSGDSILVLQILKASHQGGVTSSWVYL